MWAFWLLLAFSGPTVPIYEGTPMLRLKTSQEGVWYVLGQDGTQVHQDGISLGDPTTGAIIYPWSQTLEYRRQMYEILHSTGPQVAP